MSVAGKPIAQELGLSPVALGYLFSSFLWAYVLMMLPGGRLIDRWGAHVVAARRHRGVVGGADGDRAAVGIVTMLVARLGLGIGEAPFAPVIYRSVRAWSPYTERGTAIAVISAGEPRAGVRRAVRGLADPGAVVALVVHDHRRGRLRLGGGLARSGIDAGKDPMAAGAGAPAHPRRARRRHRDRPTTAASAISALLRCPAMWGLFISQGCLVYSLYLYLSWLPNYLQTARHLSVVDSGIYTAIPFFIATAVNIIANWIGDRLLSAEAVRTGMRRYLVALCLFLTAAGLLIPYVESLTAIIVLITIAVSFANVGPAANGALTSDLLRSPADAGRAFAFLVLGGNIFGLLRADRHRLSRRGDAAASAPRSSPRGVLALIGAAVTLVLSRGAIGEAVVTAKPLGATVLQADGAGCCAQRCSLSANLRPGSCPRGVISRPAAPGTKTRLAISVQPRLISSSTPMLAVPGGADSASEPNAVPVVSAENSTARAVAEPSGGRVARRASS